MALIPVLWGILGCGLTVTNDRPTYEELDPEEQDAVEIILRELTAFNAEVEARIDYSIDRVLDRDKISVSFEGIIFTWNFGDETIHVSTWENLSSDQRELVAQWFQLSPREAEEAYEKLFYEFMAVVQGAKQFMYEALTLEWVFANRTVFSIERDSIETALAHFEAVGRRPEMWTFLDGICAPVISQYDDGYREKFTKEYFNENLEKLASPDDPTGYMYFICRWIAWGKDDLAEYSFNLTKMLHWLEDLPN